MPPPTQLLITHVQPLTLMRTSATAATCRAARGQNETGRLTHCLRWIPCLVLAPGSPAAAGLCASLRCCPLGWP